MTIYSSRQPMSHSVYNSRLQAECPLYPTQHSLDRGQERGISWDAIVEAVRHQVASIPGKQPRSRRIYGANGVRVTLTQSGYVLTVF